MKQFGQNRNSDSDYSFVDVCKRLGINPYKERYWREEIAYILGVKPDTISKWAGTNRKSTVRLYRWNRNGRIFTKRGDLIEAFEDYESVKENEGVLVI